MNEAMKNFLENYTVPSIVELEDEELGRVLELLVNDHIIVSEKQGNLFGCYLQLQANSADEAAVKLFGDELLIAKAIPVQDGDGWTDEIVDIEDDDEYDEVVALFEALENEQE
ncbi:MAG: DUF1292 domain-containing protein [Oscillospiraceae bacterium]|nr:DUF1292 domain-containing protein [Oscillospiraceae bacterium]MBQ9960009.1 DUF1292 domain-containing protein [Oscillospiraceae bacterium]